MTEVYLIRHGESEANVAEFLDLSSDTYIFDAELTPKGKMQAKATANKLNHIEFDLIVSSPLSRALQTYEIIFSKRDIKLDINPLHREYVAHSCDIGIQPADLKKKFPNLNFKKLEKYWWNNGKKIQENKIFIESISNLNLRVKKFKKLLKTEMRKELQLSVMELFIQKLSVII